MIVYLATGEHLAYQTGILGCSTSAATDYCRGKTTWRNCRSPAFSYMIPGVGCQRYPWRRRLPHSVVRQQPWHQLPLPRLLCPWHGLGFPELARRPCCSGGRRQPPRRTQLQDGPWWGQEKDGAKRKAACSFQKQLQKAQKTSQFHGNWSDICRSSMISAHLLTISVRLFPCDNWISAPFAYLSGWGGSKQLSPGVGQKSGPWFWRKILGRSRGIAMSNIGNCGEKHCIGDTILVLLARRCIRCLSSNKNPTKYWPNMTHHHIDFARSLSLE